MSDTWYTKKGGACQRQPTFHADSLSPHERDIRREKGDGVDDKDDRMVSLDTSDSFF